MENRSFENFQSDPLFLRAKEKIIPIHDERLRGESEHPLPLVVNKNGAWLVGTRHTKNLDSEIIAGVREQRDQYMQVTPREQQLFMVEGFASGEIGPRELDELLVDARTEDEAVQRHGECGMLLWAAREKNIKIVSPEIPERELVDSLKKLGHFADEIALFEVVRQFTSDISQPREPARTPNENLIYFAKFFYSVQQLVGIKWGSVELHGQVESAVARHDVEAVHALTPQIAGAAAAELNKIFARVTQQTERPLIPSINALTCVNRGLRREQQIPMDLVNELFEPTTAGHSVINAISARVATLRDIRILEELFAARQQGRTPFLVYGASHVRTLEPAIEELGNKEQRLNELREMSNRVNTELQHAFIKFNLPYYAKGQYTGDDTRGIRYPKFLRVVAMFRPEFHESTLEEKQSGERFNGQDDQLTLFFHVTPDNKLQFTRSHRGFEHSLTGLHLVNTIFPATKRGIIPKYKQVFEQQIATRDYVGLADSVATRFLPENATQDATFTAALTKKVQSAREVADVAGAEKYFKNDSFVFDMPAEMIRNLGKIVITSVLDRSAQQMRRDGVSMSDAAEQLKEIGAQLLVTAVPQPEHTHHLAQFIRGADYFVQQKIHEILKVYRSTDRK